MKTQFRCIFILIFIYNIYYSQVCNYSFGDKIDGIGNASGVALNQIQIDANGNSIVIGRFVGSVDLDPGTAVVAYSSSGENDIFLAKYDNNGNYLWAHVFGSNGDDHGNSVSVDPNGDILITGQFSYDVDFDPGPVVYNLTGIGDRDIFICKYNSSGNFIWAKSLGSSSFETGSFIQSDQDGNAYLTGFFLGSLDFDPGPGASILSSAGFSGLDIYFAKYSSSGNFIWVKSISVPSHTDEPYDLKVDQTGNIYICGRFIGTGDFDPGVGNESLSSYDLTWGDIFLAKYDSNGAYVWAKNILSGHTFKEVGGMAIDPFGNIILTGNFGVPDIDFDPGLGNYTLPVTGFHDVFITKFDNSGNHLWAKSFGGVLDDSGNGIDINSLGDIYLTGKFRNKVDFDPSSDSTILTVTNDFQTFIAKYDQNGMFLWTRALIDNPSSGFGESSDLKLSSSEDIFVIGYFLNTIDLDPDSSIENRTCNSGSNCGFISKYTKFAVGLKENDQINEFISVYPNPAVNQITITQTDEYQMAEKIEIYNIFGQLIFLQKLHLTEQTIEPNLSKGIYFYSLSSKRKVFNGKLIFE